MSLKDSLLGLLIISIWGFNFVVIAWGVNDVPPLLLGAARFLMVACLGSLFIKKPNIPFKWLLAYAMTLCFGQFAFLFSAIAVGMPAGVASLVLQSQALFTIIFAAVLLKEAIGVKQIISLAVAALGLVIIALSQENTNMTMLGFVFTIASAISWGLGNVVNKKINQLGYKASIGLVVWSAWITVIPFTLASLYFDGLDVIVHSIINITFSGIAVIAYLAIAASITAYSLWSYLLQHNSASQVAPLTLAVPVVGIVCASYFLQEHISSMQWVGISFVMVALIINGFSSRFIKGFKRSRV